MITCHKQHIVVILIDYTTDRHCLLVITPAYNRYQLLQKTNIHTVLNSLHTYLILTVGSVGSSFMMIDEGPIATCEKCCFSYNSPSINLLTYLIHPLMLSGS